jgi:hypothetical protein
MTAAKQCSLPITSVRPLFVGDTVTLSRQINMFTVGLNYKF